mmetsp:Transcript_577/g.1517  ORF Transcript_577/g.1517 Transcript_577/m.1517 type:complete len:203 (-) Transcript_577:2641-3249(-)
MQVCSLSGVLLLLRSCRRSASNHPALQIRPKQARVQELRLGRCPVSTPAISPSLNLPRIILFKRKYYRVSELLTCVAGHTDTLALLLAQSRRRSSLRVCDERIQKRNVIAQRFCCSLSSFALTTKRGKTLDHCGSCSSSSTTITRQYDRIGKNSLDKNPFAFAYCDVRNKTWVAWPRWALSLRACTNTGVMSSRDCLIGFAP